MYKSQRILKIISILILIPVFMAILISCNNSKVQHNNESNSNQTEDGTIDNLNIENTEDTNKNDDGANKLTGVLLPVRKYEYSDDGSDFLVEKYQYDDFGRIIELEEFVVNNITEYTYDSTNRRIETLIINQAWPDGSLRKITYDSEGKVSQSDAYYENELIGICKYKYSKNRSRNIVEKLIYTKDQELRSDFVDISEYDEDWKLVKKIISNPDEKQYEILYTRDDKGNVTKEERCDSDGGVTVNEYKYDDGLLISKKYTDSTDYIDEETFSYVTADDGSVVARIEFLDDGTKMSRLEYDYIDVLQDGELIELPNID